ncbi:MAG TPA: hypothetical protein VGZ00_09025 [Candidatus Baltobacteraceae bacterium]|jgi:hypothetical protein|nr:hypothetical protein [Candidatus Baltobacteraceae bacterium]
MNESGSRTSRGNPLSASYRIRIIPSAGNPTGNDDLFLFSPRTNPDNTRTYFLLSFDAFPDTSLKNKDIPAFTDCKNEIIIHTITDRGSIEGAVQLACRHGSIVQFIEPDNSSASKIATRIALREAIIERDMEVTNPELQEEIKRLHSWKALHQKRIEKENSEAQRESAVMIKHICLELAEMVLTENCTRQERSRAENFLLMCNSIDPSEMLLIKGSPRSIAHSQGTFISAIESLEVRRQETNPFYALTDWYNEFVGRSAPAGISYQESAMRMELIVCAEEILKQERQIRSVEPSLEERRIGMSEKQRELTGSDILSLTKSMREKLANIVDRLPREDRTSLEKILAVLESNARSRLPRSEESAQKQTPDQQNRNI